MKSLRLGCVLAFLFSVFLAPLAHAGGWAGNQTYKSFDGKTYQMRVYNGQHVSLLVQEQFFSSTAWLQIDSSFGAGPWPGLRDEYFAFLTAKLDAGYEFYKALFQKEPAENPEAPNNLLRVAFVENMGAGQGLLGMKGIEIGPAYLEISMYAARDGKVQQTIFWHELGRNFGIGYNDFGIKYVLVNEMKVPTYMGWEYGVSYRQFTLNDIYLVPRYYLADPNAQLAGYATSPYTAPAIPAKLVSQALSNTNSSTLRAAMANHYYLENGFDAYGTMVRESDPYNLDNTPLGSMTGLITFMNERNRFGLDYSYWRKSSDWQIRNNVASGPQNIAVSQTVGKIGDLILLGRDNDFVQVTTPGQFRIDAGDGVDKVKLPFPGSSVVYSNSTGWKTVIITATSKIVLDFVEQVVFSDGTALPVANPGNAMFPVLKGIKAGKYAFGNTRKAAVRLRFSERVTAKTSYDWGLNVVRWNVILRTGTGRQLAKYSLTSSNTVRKGNDVYFLLPKGYDTTGSNTLTLCLFFNGCLIHPVDVDGNRLSDALWNKSYGIPPKYKFDVRTIGR